MKVMQINCVYKKGSTGKIIYDIHQYLQDNGIESLVCYGRGPKINEPNVYKTCGEFYSKINNLLSRFTGLMYGGCVFSTNKLIRIIKNETPDIVHLHCINGYFVNIYKIISFLKKHHIKTVLTLHAEFMYTGNCGYALECEQWRVGCKKCPRYRIETRSLFIDNTSLSWKKMKESFENFNDIMICSVSPWLQKRSQVSSVLGDKKNITILNGIDTSTFRYNYNEEIKTKLNIINKKVVFYVTSSFSDEKNHIKGGCYVIELAKCFLKTDTDVQFVVASKSKKPEKLPSNIIWLGNIENQVELAEYYSMADVTILTSKKETFSMVVAESLCCGTPVVGFKAGAPELITIDEFSSFIPQGDSEKLFKELQEFLYNKVWDKEKISIEAKKKYGKDVMGENYLKLYQEMMK